MATSASFLDLPVSRSLEPVLHHLASGGYTDTAIREITEHCARFHTAQCCMWIDPGDLDAIEALLPHDPLWHLPMWDDDRYELDPEGER